MHKIISGLVSVKMMPLVDNAVSILGKNIGKFQIWLQLRSNECHSTTKPNSSPHRSKLETVELQYFTTMNMSSQI